MAKNQSVTLERGVPLRVATGSGNVTVTGEERPDLAVEDDPKVTSTEEGIKVAKRSGSITLRCPTGTDVFVGTGSGKVSLQGVLGAVRVTTGSGDISVAGATSVDARSGSGSIDVGDCAGSCSCRSGSGSLRVQHAGSVELAAASGRVEAADVGAAKVRAGSGSVAVGLFEAGPVVVEAHSGSVDVTVPAGVHPATQLRAKSGSVRCECDEGADGSITVTTHSGSISVTAR
jgi:hypothetical protein